MSIKITSPATVLPVNLVTALRALRALAGEADLVALYLAAATERLENYTGRSLVTKTYLLQVNDWPSSTKLELRRTPLASVTSIKYYPLDGSAQVTIDPSNYRVTINSEPGFVTFGSDYTFPDIAVRADAVEVTFVAGYGTSESSIPPILRAGILMLGRQYYDNPAGMKDQKFVDMKKGVQDIFWAYRVESLTNILGPEKTDNPDTRIFP